MVFMQPQRLVVPLFQRPYVWNEENQWVPLWNDIVRVADRVLAKPHTSGKAAEYEALHELRGDARRQSRPPAGSKFRRRQVQLAMVGDTVEISIGEELIRSHPVRHDRTREHGALATRR
jgi:hypothetical protein